MHPLRAYREARGLTIDDVVEKTAISRASVSRIETGKQYPSQPALLKLLSFTGNRLTPNDFYPRAPDGPRA